MSARQNPFGHRSVRCKKHGVAYNPDLYSGCALCRRESESATSTEKREELGTPFMLGISVFVMAVCLLAVITGERAFRAHQVDVVDEQEDRIDVTRETDPTPFHAEIASVEAVLYQNRPAEPADEDRLQASLSALIGRLDEAEWTDRTLTLVQRFGRRTLGTGYVMNLPSVREDWESIRDAAFVPVPWFRKSTLQLTQQQTPEFVESPELVATRFEDVLADLESLITEGETEALQMLGTVAPAIAGVTPEAEEDDPLQRWSESWRERLDAVVADRPAPPGGEPSPPELSEVDRLLRSAVAQLRLVPVDAFRGARGDVELRFTKARSVISEAKQVLVQGLLATSGEETGAASLTA